MSGEVIMAQIYVREADHGRRKQLVKEVLELLRDRYGIHGVTVLRAIAGFGASGEVHAADLLHLAAELPLVIEFFDAPELVEPALAALADIVPAGHIVSWSATRR